MSEARPTLFLLGATHRTTPIELREKLALPPDRIDGFRTRLAALPGLREYAVLNTCNRVEFYGLAETPETVPTLRAAFCAHQGLSPDDFARFEHHASGRDAVEHLVTVASGLDSQMLGETEILGQVKDAYAEAQSLGSTGPVLNRLFQKSFQYAKHVRTHTAITEGQISVANVAVDLALKIFGELSRTPVLLLGAGEIGEKTAKAFRSRGAERVTVASRTLENAMAVATSLGAAALPWDQVHERLSDFAVVVGSTAAPDAVVTRAHAAAAMRRRPADPLFFIDLALPRDIEPAVAELENVFLYNLDDLARIAEANLAARAAEVAKARHLVAEKTDTLWRHLAPLAPGGA